MLRSRWFVALLFLASAQATAWGQDTADIKWKFEAGKTFYQELKTSTVQDMTVMGMKINQTQKQTFFFSWTPGKQDTKDKCWPIKQKIEGLTMDIQIGGSPITYDSTKDTATSSPLADFFKALVGAEFTLTVCPDPKDGMKVTKVEGREDFLKKLVTANQQMEPLLKQILSDEALKQMADPAFAVVPTKPVKKGETWDKKATLNMGPIGTYETTYKFTYEGKDEKQKNLDRIKVETSLKYQPPAAGTTTSLPFKITNADLKTTTSDGFILFDVEKGRVDSSELNLTLDGKLTIDISGMTSEVELKQKQTTTLKTTDVNPIKKDEPKKEEPKKEDKKPEEKKK